MSRQTPEFVAEKFLRGFKNGLTEGTDEADSFKSSFTYDQAEIAKAQKVRIELKSNGGALAGVLISERYENHGWLLESYVTCAKPSEKTGPA